MSWLIAHWRLKLLALGLTLGLLGAVAFSQNPPQATSVPVGISYVNQPEDVVLTKYPSTVNVKVIGLADAVRQFSSNSVGVTVSLDKAKPGPSQTYYAKPKVVTAGVTLQDSSIPLVLNIEALRLEQLDVEVRTNQPAPGIAVVPDKTYATCGDDNTRCKVSVTGPAGQLEGLRAFVKFDVPITAAAVQRAPGLPVFFEQNGRPIDLKSIVTLPPPTIDHPVVGVKVQAEGGTQTRSVGLTIKAIGAPACGYQVDRLEIAPNSFVNISGPSEAVSKITSIALADVPISGATATVTMNRPVNPGTEQVKVDPPGVRVTVAISQAFSCAAPTPTPQPTPSAR